MSDTCDKEYVQRNFTEDLERYYRVRREKSQLSWDERIADIIAAIEGHESNPTMKSFINDKLFNIIEYKGTKVLTTKQNATMMIPSDLFFDVIYDAHIATGHGGGSELTAYLKKVAYIPRQIIYYLPKHCRIIARDKLNKSKICRYEFKNREVRPLVTCDYKRGYVDIIDMSEEPAGEYHHILYYQDVATKFCHLRPLTDDSPATVTRELAKIFLNLGGPVIMHSSKGCQFVESITKGIFEEIPGHTIVIGKDLPEKDHVDVIMHTLRNWMTVRDSRDWAKGVHHVQFDMNCSINKITNSMPYGNVFAMQPKVGLDVSGMTEEFIQSLTENDLLKWRHKEAKSKEKEEREKGKRIRKQRKIKGTSKEKSCGKRASKKWVDVDSETNYITSEEDIETEDIASNLPSTSANSRVFCWVCSLVCDSSSFVCAKCNSIMHEKCGAFDNSNKMITCTFCTEEAQLEDLMETTDDAYNTVEPKQEADNVEITVLNEEAEMIVPD